MEDTNGKIEEQKVLELSSCSTIFDRDLVALEVMKIFIGHQGEKRVSIVSRISFWLGLEKWKHNFDYNFQNIAEKSYEMADYMLKEREK